MKLTKYLQEMDMEDEKWVIKIKAPGQKEWKSKIYKDFNDAYDDFGKAVKDAVKKYKLQSPADLEYRFIDDMNNPWK